MKELIEELRVKASMISLGEKIAWGSDTEAMNEAADAIERLELEAVAATLRIENDAQQIKGWKADQKENLRNQCDLVADRDTWKARCEFSFAERDKLLTTNSGLVHDKESDRLAYLAMRDERDVYQQAADTQADDSHLRLAVSLNAYLQMSRCGLFATWCIEPTDDRWGGAGSERVADYNGDKYAAMRAAITHAAGIAKERS